MQPPSRPLPGAKTPNKRLVGLNARQREALAQVAHAHARGDLAGASANWLMASMEAPEHPEILRWAAQLHLADGDTPKAVAALRRAVEQRPDDPQLLVALGSALANEGDYEASLEPLRQAAGCTTQASDWLELAIAFDQQGQHAEALAAAEKTLGPTPQSSRARMMRARCLQAIGRISEAATEYRRVIANGTDAARAWFGLLDLKTEAITPAELHMLERAESLALDPDERSLLGFALGQALEAAGRFDEAFATLFRANRAAGGSRPWNPTAFSAQTSAITAACERITIDETCTRGTEVVFLVGLPRSGSTLFEQVLAAHPQVEGASELPWLERVLAQESQRRRLPLEIWAPQASAADWERLGQQYLAATAHWRRARPISTDKMPGNWRLAGAAMAMLPGAHFVDCRRDGVETGFSCFKQLFAPGLANWAFDFAHIAAYWKDYLAVAGRWSARQSQRFRTFHYEALVAEPETCIRALLEFCALPFEPACLTPHTANRAIRTPSSAQVRQPIRSGTARAERYASWLGSFRQRMET